MFEKERAEIKVLANIADAQRLDRARDLLLLAEYEFRKRAEWWEIQRIPADEKTQAYIEAVQALDDMANEHLRNLGVPAQLIEGKNG